MKTQQYIYGGEWCTRNARYFSYPPRAIISTMLRTLTSPAFKTSAGRSILTPHLVSRAAAARSFSSGLPRFNPALESKPTDVSAAKGSEGLHRSTVLSLISAPAID